MAASLRIDAAEAWIGPRQALTEASVVASEGELVYVGRTSAAPAAAVVHEVPFLLPGFRDDHVHVGLVDPSAMVAGGLTSVRDLGWPLAEIQRLARRSRIAGTASPSISFCGPMLTAVGGYPTDRAWAPAGTGEEVNGAEQAAAAVSRAVAAGAVAIKVVLNARSGALLGDDELTSICEAAHRQGREVVAHVEGAGQVERAIAAGVDELAHTPWTEVLEPGLVRELAARCRVVSTLEMHRANGEHEALATAVENLAAFRAAGGAVRYGTDLGNGPLAAGINLSELRHLARAGLATEELLAACTDWPLASGRRADLVGLDGNPLQELDAIERITLVVRGGAMLG